MYIQIDRDDIWNVYTKESAAEGLYRGGGNAATARMYKDENGNETVRPADFKIIFDSSAGEYMVYPDITKGLSFSSSLQRLKDIPIKGKVWLLPRNAELPKDLVINYKTIDHPLLNVGKKMSVKDLVEKLKELEKSMKATGVKIL
ncbi:MULTISPECIES: hypothetical protein [Rhodanobacter]|uniref:Uncharacterized protein n=1 Tax=Rhodanobacter sp. IGA1.0 TaxID=3158582 RepID=A0AAU7QN97_9GAMM|nr:hypothetical protein [Rhodanobacter spathiphylli]